MCQGGDFTAGNGMSRFWISKNLSLIEVKELAVNRYTARSSRMKLSQSNTPNPSFCRWYVAESQRTLVYN